MVHKSSTAGRSKFPERPSPIADLDTTWAYLSSGVDHIMTRMEVGLPVADHMNLQTAIFNYCTSSKMHDGIGAGNRTGANLIGFNLYNKLGSYLASHLQLRVEKSESLQDVDLLRYYAAQWDRYAAGANYLNRLFAYLNRFWVQRERDEGKKDVYQVSTFALVQWKLHFLAHIQKGEAKLTNTVLRLITQERSGEPIDQDLVKKVVDSFVSLGLDSSNLNKECLDVYRDQFENAFLHATKIYYESESKAFLAENSVSDYVKKAEERLKEEEARVELYLHVTTRKDLVSTCENVLIRAHSELMWESFQSLLDSDAEEDLQRMYALLSRIPEDLEPLRRRFEMHVKQAGLFAISKLVGENGANADSLDPKAYVDALLEVHRENSETVQRCFEGETGFTVSLDKACREFVNCNAATGSSSTKSAELIAKHTDMLIRKKNKMTEEDLEGALNRAMILFKYLDDKDAFQTLYATKLSERLIHGVSASDESEASMISKLREDCGLDYTNKLEQMLTDMSLGKVFTDLVQGSHSPKS